MTDTEKEAMLRRAFVDHRADFVTITSRHEERQLASVCYGDYMGWLQMSIDNRDIQSTVFIYRLTDAGRKHFFPGEFK